MIFKDRQGQHLNRKKLKVISQSPTELIVDIERFDEATEEGTQINASVFNTFQNEINNSNNKANNAVSTANTSNTISNDANQKSDLAVEKATKAETESKQAINISNSANNTSEQALTTAESALSSSENAVSLANSALNTANNSNTTANTANLNSQNAINTANSAKQNSEVAITTSTRADNNASTALTKSEKAIEDSAFAKAKSIDVEKALADRGATVLFGETPQSTVEFTSNPQVQLNNKLEKSFNNYSVKNTLSNDDIFIIQDSQTKQNLKVTMKSLATTVVNATYPVGAIYMSVNATNPSLIFGGEWVAWGAGRVPIGIGNNGETNYTSPEQIGGSENSIARHTHTQNAHTHNGSVSIEPNTTTGNFTAMRGGSDGIVFTQAGTNSNKYGGSTVNREDIDFNMTHNHSTTSTIDKSVATNNNAGVDGGNRQPYITCYMWKRVS